jgi:hypothetical protein
VEKGDMEEILQGEKEKMHRRGNRKLEGISYLEIN